MRLYSFAGRLLFYSFPERPFGAGGAETGASDQGAGAAYAGAGDE